MVRRTIRRINCNIYVCQNDRKENQILLNFTYYYIILLFKLFSKELVGSNSNARNWKGICISFLVIFFVCSMIVMAVIIKKPRNI